MSKKPTVLMILDGFGLNDKTEGNAVAQANKPNIDALMKDYPSVRPEVLRQVRWHFLLPMDNLSSCLLYTSRCV